jgi:hypothetical protein
VVNTIGDEGYLALTEKVLDGVDRLVSGISALGALRVVVPPESTLVAFATDATCDVFTITDAMTRAGWYVQPQLSFEGGQPTIHLSLSAATADHVEEFLVALSAAVAGAVSSGPIAIDPGIVDFVRSLDASALTDEDFDGLRAVIGMAGGEGIGLPESMAEINALLDLAAPALREALLTAFLDRLLRPAHPRL